MFFSLVVSTLFLGIFCGSFGERYWNETDPIRGRPCLAGETGKTQIFWYYDSPREVVYPYKYLGCGETNGAEYWKAQLLAPVDPERCLGFFESPEECSKVTVNNTTEWQCKDGLYCQRYIDDYLGGFCCNEEIGARYLDNRKAKCPPGSKATIHDFIGYNETLFGKKCSHEFCPDGSKCIDGEFEAYCCQKV